MDIEYKSKALQKAFREQKQANRDWGVENAKKLLQRHGELKAAESLADFAKLPAAGFHPLKGNRAGQFACHGKHPYRIVFEAVQESLPLKANANVDLSKVTRIRILEVVDYHGK
jgi:proteic killer suppression protein